MPITGTFTGEGTAPYVTGVSLRAGGAQLVVVFSEPMKHDAAVETPANYTFVAGTGGVTPVVQAASHVEGSSSVTVSLFHRLSSGVPHTLTVNTALRDAQDNTVEEGNNTFAFVGYSDPTVVSALEYVTSTTLKVTFDHRLYYYTSDYTNPANYQLSADLVSSTRTVIAAAVVAESSYTQMLLTLDAPLTTGVNNYSLRVSGFNDSSKNPIDDTFTFSGVGVPAAVTGIEGYLASSWNIPSAPKITAFKNSLMTLASDAPSTQTKARALSSLALRSPYKPLLQYFTSEFAQVDVSPISRNRYYTIHNALSPYYSSYQAALGELITLGIPEEFVNILRLGSMGNSVITISAIATVVTLAAHTQVNT